MDPKRDRKFTAVVVQLGEKNIFQKKLKLKLKS